MHRVTLDTLARIGLDHLGGEESARAAIMHPVEPDGDRLGVKWCRRITWPDRLPGLVTWGGQQSLAKLIRERQKAVKAANAGPLIDITAPMKGVSGLDNLAAGDPLDIGFNPASLGIPIIQRPAAELLAIVGLETVPLVSFSRRVVGIIHDGVIWKMKVQPRGNYGYFRWPHLMHAVPVGAVDPAEMEQEPSHAD